MRIYMCVHVRYNMYLNAWYFIRRAGTEFAGGICRVPAFCQGWESGYNT